MDRLGPWDPARRVAVAVSGGADSLALAVLTQGWGDPVAFIVDHGLREGSALEAERARAALQARSIPAQVLTLRGLAGGPGLPARARTARYAALAGACRAAGLVDLLLGHHAGDQAETVLMRRRRGSGPAGLAGMAALVETDDVRLLRPLLFAMPAELRAVVAEAGLVPAEDPTNADLRFTRARLRREIGGDGADLLAEAVRAGTVRAVADTAVAVELAQRVAIFPEGYAVLSPGPVGEAALGAVLRSLAGRIYPVNAGPFATSPRAGTLAGVRVQPAGRAGRGWLLTREVAAIAPAAPAAPGAVWDGRFRVERLPNEVTIGALGAEASRFRSATSLPSAVLQALPALAYNGVLFAVPHLSYDSGATGMGPPRLGSACVPVAGAPFRGM